jgi:hypothetical protein
MCFSIQSASALGPAGNEYPANSIDAQEAAASLAELPTPADSADLADNEPEIQSGSRRPAGKTRFLTTPPSNYSKITAELTA